ncbi:Nn.00g005560.m01.CDS01 [Neocucurbitaria sp. VM-36]
MTQHHIQGAYETKGPSWIVWESHRQEIIDLYHQHPLDVVRNRMQEKYEFKASARMYLSRLKTWGALKNWKAEGKNHILRQLTDPTLMEPIAVSLDLDKDKRRKLRRHIRACLNDVEISSGDSESSESFIGTPESNGEDREDSTDIRLQSVSNCATRASTPGLEVFNFEPENSRTSMTDDSFSNAADLFAGIGSRFFAMSLSTNSIFSSDVDLGLKSTHLVLKSIQALFSGTMFWNTTETASLTSCFWNDVGYAIYLLKISSPVRAWTTLDKACKSASTLQFESTSCVHAMLTVLSPINTKHCPELRGELLRYLSNIVKIKHGGSHPVATMAHWLLDDAQTKDTSERSLNLILDLLTVQYGTCHPLTIKTHTGLIRLLRRDGDLPAAHGRGRQLLSIACREADTLSLVARKAARELEHVLMDMSAWEEALQLCFMVVGQAKSKAATIDPQHIDECSVHAMEDISKIYGAIGKLPLYQAWLEKAVTIAWKVWPKGWVGVDHIVDKLSVIPRSCGTSDLRSFTRLQ